MLERYCSIAQPLCMQTRFLFHNQVPNIMTWNLNKLHLAASFGVPLQVWNTLERTCNQKYPNFTFHSLGTSWIQTELLVARLGIFPPNHFFTAITFALDYSQMIRSWMLYGTNWSVNRATRNNFSLTSILLTPLEVSTSSVLDFFMDKIWKCGSDVVNDMHAWRKTCVIFSETIAPVPDYSAASSFVHLLFHTFNPQHMHNMSPEFEFRVCTKSHTYAHNQNSRNARSCFTIRASKPTLCPRAALERKHLTNFACMKTTSAVYSQPETSCC